MSVMVLPDHFGLSNRPRGRSTERTMPFRSLAPFEQPHPVGPGLRFVVPDQRLPLVCRRSTSMAGVGGTANEWSINCFAPSGPDNCTLARSTGTKTHPFGKGQSETDSLLRPYPERRKAR